MLNANPPRHRDPDRRLTLLTGLAYPLAMTGIAGVAVPASGATAA